MSKEMRCPHCGQTLRQSQHIEPLTGQNLYFCDTHDCYPTECVIGTQSMWTALIQSQRDLKIAKQALETAYARGFTKSEAAGILQRNNMTIVKALKQITHDNNNNKD